MFVFFLINSGLNLVPDLNADLKKSIKKCLNEAEQSKEMFESRLNQKAAEILEKTTQIEYKIIKRSDELIESINQDRKILLDTFKLNDQLKNFKIEFSFNASPTSSQTLLMMTFLSEFEVRSNNFCRSTPPTQNKSSDFAIIFFMSTPSNACPK